MVMFTRGERRVMRILWQHGEMPPGEIQKHYPEPIKNSALRSYLTILVAKGHVARRKVGKAYHYQAVTRHPLAFRETLRELLDTYCGGSTRALLMNLIRSEQLDEEELLQLKRLADEQSPLADESRQG